MFTQGFPELTLDGTHGDITAVGGFVGIVAGIAMRKHGIAALGKLPGKLLPDQGDGKQADHGVRHGDVDVLALPGFLAGKQGEQDADGSIHPAAGHISKLHPRNGGRAVRFTQDVQDAGIAQVIDIVPGFLGKRPCLSVSGYRAIDDGRVYPAHRFVIDTQSLNYTRPKTFQDHIRILDQACKYFLSGL